MVPEFVDVDDFVDERFIGELPTEEYIEEDLAGEGFSPFLLAEVMENAALFVGHGWIQGRPFKMIGDQRHVCANGALWLATGLSFTDAGDVQFAPRFDGVRHALWSAAVDALSEHVGLASFLWNDANGQSKAQVMYTMMALAKKLREEQ